MGLCFGKQASLVEDISLLGSGVFPVGPESLEAKVNVFYPIVFVFGGSFVSLIDAEEFCAVYVFTALKRVLNFRLL